MLSLWHFLARVCSALSKPTVSSSPAVTLCLLNFFVQSLSIFIFDFYIVANHFMTFTYIFSPFKLRSVYVLGHGQLLSQVHKQKVQIWFSCSPFYMNSSDRILWLRVAFVLRPSCVPEREDVKQKWYSCKQQSIRCGVGVIIPITACSYSVDIHVLLCYCCITDINVEIINRLLLFGLWELKRNWKQLAYLRHERYVL